MRRLSHVLGAGAALALACSGAVLAATPLQPANGSTAASPQPTLTWSLASGEAATEVEVATSSTATADGGFDPKSIVGRTPVSDTATEWSPPLLFTGTYYWHVETHDVNFFYHWSPVSSFTVPVSLRIASITMPTTVVRSLILDVHYSANIRSPLLAVRVLYRGHRVWTAKKRETLATPADGSSGIFTWLIPAKIKRAGKLTVIATLSGGGSSARKARVVTAP